MTDPLTKDKQFRKRRGRRINYQLSIRRGRGLANESQTMTCRGNIILLSVDDAIRLRDYLDGVLP